MYAVEFLLNNGADVNTCDEKGFTLLMFLVTHNDIPLIEFAIKKGARVNDVSLCGLSALDYAVKENNLEIVRILVENGAIITDSSYMLAIRKRFKRIISYFDSFDENKQIFLR
jgi:ankyrin repeat protein